MEIVYYICLRTRLWRHKFWNNLIFLIKSFFCMTKKSRHKRKYLENEKSFKSEIKSIFIIFRELSVAKNCFSYESALLRFRSRSSYPEVFLEKKCSENMQEIYRGTPMPIFGFDNVAKQLYWNSTLAWAFSSKFAVYFQNIFS